jgi:hypothetical protein
VDVQSDNARYIQTRRDEANARQREQGDAGDYGATPVQWPGSFPCHSNRRSARMRVKLQLVLCSDEGQEETVTDVITLNKNNGRIEHLGSLNL